ncbi:hypothetical protein BDP27DRAFT_1417482 [Rhodocollybia butyracea]|uniref:Uncharacterized protein n=1 Tax=Rhodocollybia butyracea TaxID=206335 RepID=A0A9P5Q3P2_9AGAR|nr:hypothetical protein BDP27DRAFT_1417482 [Rhodocollybia butyracea]
MFQESDPDITLAVSTIRHKTHLLFEATAHSVGNVSENKGRAVRESKHGCIFGKYPVTDAGRLYSRVLLTKLEVLLHLFLLILQQRSNIFSKPHPSWSMANSSPGDDIIAVQCRLPTSFAASAVHPF